MLCGYSLVVEHQLPKLNVRVRFPLPAVSQRLSLWLFVCMEKHFAGKNTMRYFNKIKNFSASHGDIRKGKALLTELTVL